MLCIREFISFTGKFVSLFFFQHTAEMLSRSAALPIRLKLRAEHSEISENIVGFEAVVFPGCKNRPGGKDRKIGGIGDELGLQADAVEFPVLHPVLALPG